MLCDEVNASYDALYFFSMKGGHSREGGRNKRFLDVLLCWSRVESSAVTVWEEKSTLARNARNSEHAKIVNA
jgi:hypothetical protein